MPWGLKAFTQLEKLAGVQEESLGWFGYSSYENQPATLDVWIYCQTSKAAHSPVSKTMEFVQKRWGQPLTGSITTEEGHVRISVNGDAVPDDRSWFVGVY